MPRASKLAIFSKEAELDEESPESEGEHRKNSGRYQDSIRRPGRQSRRQGSQVHDEEHHVEHDHHAGNDERRETGDPLLGPSERLAHGFDLE